MQPVPLRQIEVTRKQERAQGMIDSHPESRSQALAYRSATHAPRPGRLGVETSGLGGCLVVDKAAAPERRGRRVLPRGGALAVKEGPGA